MNRWIVAIGISLLFLITIAGGVYFAVTSSINNSSSTKYVKNTKETNKSEEEQLYELGINAIKEKDYITATAKLKKLSAKDSLPSSISSAKYAYIYAQSQLYYSNGNKKEAFELLKGIPSDYNGDFSDEISILKDVLSKGTINSSTSDQKGLSSSSENETSNSSSSNDTNSENLVMQKISQIRDDISLNNDAFERDYAFAEGQKNAKSIQYELEMQNAKYRIRKYNEIISLLKSVNFEREDVRLSQIKLHENLIQIEEKRYNRALNAKYRD